MAANQNPQARSRLKPARNPWDWLPDSQPRAALGAAANAADGAALEVVHILRTIESQPYKVIIPSPAHAGIQLLTNFYTQTYIHTPLVLRQ